MYRLANGLDLAGGRPSLLIPIFVQTNTNVAFVQETDKSHCLVKFLPYYYSDEYSVCRIDRDLFVEVGEPAVVLFRCPSRDLFFGRVGDIPEYLSDHKEELLDFPLLRMQLLRFTGEKFAVQYEAWREVKKRYFSSPARGDAWLDAEVSLYQKRSIIWEKLAALDADKNGFAIEVGEISESDYERILNALTSSNFYDAINWEEAWFLLYNLRPMDERLRYVAQKWLYYKLSGGVEVSDAKNIFCATVDAAYASGEWDESFSELLLDAASSYLIFSDDLDVPNRIVEKIFLILEKTLDSGEYVDLILSTIEKTYLSRAVLSLFLKQVVDAISGIDSEHRREWLKELLPKIESHAIDPTIALYMEQLRQISDGNLEL